MVEKKTPRPQTANSPARTKTSGRGRALEFAALAAPVALAAAKKLLENPDVGKKVQEQIDRLFKHSGDSAEDMQETVKALREQVDFLATSADDEIEKQRACSWSKQLEQCQRAAHLVSAPGATRKQRRALNKRISALRSEILEAFISEQYEDSGGASAATGAGD